MAEVRENADERRFELWVDDQLAGTLRFSRRDDTYALVHTEIEDAFEGRGLGSVLVSGVLEQLRERGMAVLPVCPFVRRYVSRHPEHLPLVPVAQRARFDLPAR